MQVVGPGPFRLHQSDLRRYWKVSEEGAEGIVEEDLVARSENEHDDSAYSLSFTCNVSFFVSYDEEQADESDLEDVDTNEGAIDGVRVQETTCIECEACDVESIVPVDKPEK